MDVDVGTATEVFAVDTGYTAWSLLWIWELALLMFGATRLVHLRAFVVCVCLRGPRCSCCAHGFDWRRSPDKN